MTTAIKEVVNVEITRETRSVSRRGFGVPLIIDVHKGFNELIKFYSSASEVAEDFPSTEAVKLMADTVFAQSPTVERLAIGRRASADLSVLTVVAADTFTYTVKVNGQTATYTSGVSETATAIAAQLKTAIDALSEPITVTDNLDGTLDIEPTVASTPYSLVVVSAENLTVAHTSSQAVDLDLAAIFEVDPDWYGVLSPDRTQATVETIAAWTEVNERIFMTASADVNIVDTTDAADTTTIAAVLKSLSRERSGVIYHPQAATQYPDAALLGTILPLDPGSYTGAFKLLTGVAVTNLSSTQRKNALDKNANIYIETGGTNITREGTVALGEYIDIIIFVDWLQARMTERIFGVLVNSPKIPYTDPGIAGIKGEIVAQIQDGQAAGGIALSDGNGNPAFTVTVPRVADIDPALKAARRLEGVTFTALLAGAIHFVEVKGTVTL